MKKLLLLAAVAALALNVSLWGGITVTSPNGTGQAVGGSITVTWTSSGVAGGTLMTISLRKTTLGQYDEPNAYIAQHVANSGTYGPWTIPAVPDGDYFVRVRTDDATMVGNSVNFHISAGATITVPLPSGTPWTKGNSYSGTWSSSGITQNVTIALRKTTLGPTDEPNAYIAQNVANSGSFGPWTVPNDATVPAGTYFVRVRTQDATVRGDSPTFQINDVGGGRIPWDPRWWLKKYIEVKWPPDPDPCLCPEWSIKEILERIRGVDPKFAGSLGLLKNGVKIQDLLLLNGRKTPLESLAPSLKPSLSRKNFNAFKNGSAKFSLGIFDAQGNLLQELPLQGEQGQQLR